MEFVKACFQDMLLKDGCMWFFDNRIQAVCKMDIDNFKIEIISVYKSERRFNVRKIFEFQNKFYFAGGDSARLLIYNGNAKESSLNFCLQEPFLQAGAETYVAFQYDDCIYFLPPSMNEKMVCFDMSTQKYSEMPLCDSLMKKEIGDSRLEIGYPCFYENAIWFPIQRTSFYVKYSLAEKKADLFQEADKEIMLSGICFDGKNIWLTQKESGDIACVGKRMIRVSVEQSYSWLYNAGNYVVVSVRFGDKILFIDKETLEAIMINLPFNETEKQYDKGHDIINCCESDDFIILLQHGFHDLLVLYKNTFEIKRVKLQCENYIEKCFWGNERLAEEQEDVNLKHLIQFSGRESSLIAGCEGKVTSGETVWANMRRGS